MSRPESSRLALDVIEETVALGGVVLGAGLEHLDRAGNGGERGSQFVCRVRDELALGALAPFADGDIRHDEDDVLRAAARRDSRDRVRTPVVGLERLLDRPCAGLEEPGGQHLEYRLSPGVRQFLALVDGRAQQPARGSVGELDAQVRIDGDHAVVEASEEPLEAVALRLEPPERLAQPPPHPVDRLRQASQLVLQPWVETGVEAPSLDRISGMGYAA